MFSYGIVLRNHDSHRIIDTSTDQVINQPKDIVLGNHVWIGQNATILKGANVGDNSVIGFGSVVTSSCEPGSVLAGVPAKVVRHNVNWDY
jgi:acetyltransferase-like isoleucine patch superfamily enzyme